MKVAKPRNFLPCQEKGGGRRENAMIIMMKINEISDIWERNKTKASTRGRGVKKLGPKDFILLYILKSKCTETSLEVSA